MALFGYTSLMKIKSIELQNFRNYRAVRLEPEDGTTVLYGKNAQGKTNLLEAVYVGATSKSPRTSKDRDLIRFGEDEAHLRMIVVRDGMESRIDMHFRKNKSKGIAINGVPIRRATELFGIASVVLFSPEDLSIIKNGPAERRRFMDAELCQLDRIYLSDLSKYQRVLDQRSKLLKEIYEDPKKADTLDVWDAQLVQYGSRVIRRRRQFLQEIRDTVEDLHRNLTGGTEEISVSYEPNTEDVFFADALFAARDKDIRLGQTSCGPHRDDIRFTANGIDIRQYGSQGQQRTCALSLKLSEIAIVEKARGEKPVLLLDDVLSELDSDRQRFLLSSIRDTQTIITCTGLDEFVKNQFSIDRMYHVEEGTIELYES